MDTTDKLIEVQPTAENFCDIAVIMATLGGADVLIDLPARTIHAFTLRAGEVIRHAGELFDLKQPFDRDTITAFCRFLIASGLTLWGKMPDGTAVELEDRQSDATPTV